MKRILMIGDANHQFIIALVRNIRRRKPDIVIDIFNIKSSIENKHKPVYNEVVNSSRRNKIINRVPFLNSIYHKNLSQLDFNKVNNNYDVAHIHMASSIAYHLRKNLKKKVKKTVLTVWGSDFYRASPKFKNKLFKLYQKADIITFTNSDTLGNFSDFYKLGNKDLRLIRFGLDPLELLKGNIGPKEISKTELNLMDDKLVVTIGYNASPQQQHLEILNVLKNSSYSNEFRKRCHFVFPLTYAKRHGYNNYKEQLTKLLNEADFSYSFHENFLSDIALAHLRNSSDIMIQLQTTDQFSGSMQEYLFTDNVVITGSWLPYSDFEEEGIYFRKIDFLSDLDQDLRIVLNNLIEQRQKTENNKSKIYGLSSWTNTINGWLNLYN